MSKVIQHFKLICQHKYYVFKACCEAGIPIQGLTHDLSKFSPTEFLESVRYYTGNRSPIDNCKDKKGYSKAWLHHRGHNKHHWEYWLDNFQDGVTPILMPFNYALEMFCDFYGAGKAYRKKEFNWKDEWEWWLDKREVVIMHPIVWHFIDYQFTMFRNCPHYKLNYLECQKKYYELLADYEQGLLKGQYRSKDKPFKIETKSLDF